MDLKFYVGKYKSSNSYTQRADQTITNVGLILPFTMTFYGLLIQLGIISSPNNNVNLFGFGLIMFVWLLVGIAQKLRPGKTPLDSTFRLIQFFTMSGVYFLLISGVSNPFIVCWPILMLASYTYFEKSGLYLGIIAFTTIIFLDIFVYHLNDPNIIAADILLYISIMVTGLAVITVMRTHEIRKEILFKTIIKESFQRDRVATIVNNLTDAIISTDMNGKINVYNAASMSLLDTNADLNGKPIEKVLQLVDINGGHVSILSEIKHSKTVVRRDDLNYVFSDGEKIRLEVTYTPIRGGYVHSKKGEIHDGYIIIMRDITKIKSIEEERDEFISVISHELRTPITITEGTISNVQEIMDHQNATYKMIEDSITVAHDQVLFLANIVNDLSALSRAERGVDNQPEIIDTHEFVNDVIGPYSEEAKKKGLRFSLIIDPNIRNVYASKVYLEELTEILLNNAVKYTKKGGVTFSIKESSNTIKFSIKDTGIGINKTDQPKIFDKFYRSEDFRTRETGGTGLGLYVAATVATRLSTSIELESKVNVGSIFSFSLPVYGKKGTKKNV